MYYPDVPALEPEELELLCHEYVEHNATLDPHLADQMGVKRGLRNLDGTGVLAGITNQVPQTAGEPPLTAPRLCRRYDLELAFAQPDEQDGAKRAGHVQLR